MPSVTAHYTSPTHSLNVDHVVEPAESQKESLESLRQAILATQADLNVFLTKRKLEEDRANGVNGTSVKREVVEDEEADEDGEEDEVNEEEE